MSSGGGQEQEEEPGSRHSHGATSGDSAGYGGYEGYEGHDTFQSGERCASPSPGPGVGTTQGSTPTPLCSGTQYSVQPSHEPPGAPQRSSFLSWVKPLLGGTLELRR